MESIFNGIEKLGPAGLVTIDSSLAAGNLSPGWIHCAATMVPRPLLPQKE